MFAQLLAKRVTDPADPREYETLVGHTRCVMGSAKELWRIVKPPLAAMRGVTENNLDWLNKALCCAAWMHDWGKANGDFQTMIRSGALQGIRHESVTWLIADRLDGWLSRIWSDAPPWVKPAVLYAVAGHHLKFPDKQERPGTAVEVYVNHDDFIQVLTLGVEDFGLDAPPSLVDFTIPLRGCETAKRTILRMRKELRVDFDDIQKTLIAIVKTLLMNADLAGSALPRTGTSHAAWIGSKLSACLSGIELEKIVASKFAGREPRPFQMKLRDADAKTVLVEAGCGSGKTAAAYLWAARNANGRRLFFCYPTTCTASEGFSGYLHEPDFDALLVHGRARIDYELLENMPPRNDEAERLHTLRLEALEMWPFPAVVCTAHTVLGMLENTRRGLYAFPSFLQGVFVFDEIHAFSDTLFAYLLRFLEAFSNTPVLLMTATLPESRKQALEMICITRGSLVVIEGPPGARTRSEVFTEKGFRVRGLECRE